MKKLEINDDHLDPTAEISLDIVKERAVKGVAILTGRTFVLKLISFIAQGLLFAFILPDQYGVFLTVAAAINFLSYFADIGLGAALIQMKEKPDKDDYKTVFTIQEIMVLTIVLVAFLLSPMLTRTHSLDNEAIYLLYALNIAFFLASLKNIPSIILERRLEFGKFVIPQVLENLFYNVFLVYFAWKGFGITSFTYAVLIRGIVGVVIIYIIQPWKPVLGISKKSVKSLLKFGVPYQLNNFLATLKDDGMTIILGGILGNFGLGILGTARQLAQYPLRFFLDTVSKVTFPAFSRMQDDKKSLSNALTRSIFFICALVFPSVVGLIVLFEPLLTIVPRYQKWEAVLIPLAVLSVDTFWAASTTQLTNFLNAIGKIKTTFKFMIMWTALTWLTLPLFSRLWGVNGAAFGFALVATSSFVVFYTVKKIVDLSITIAIIKPLLASFLMGLTTWFLVLLKLPFTVFGFFGAVILAGGIYLFFLYVLIGDSLKDDVKKLFSTTIKR